MLTFDLWPLQAADSRDSLAMKLYAQCFKWIIQKINNRIKGFGTYCSIGVLDIFGFENFEVSKPSTLDDDTALELLHESSPLCVEPDIMNKQQQYKSSQVLWSKCTCKRNQNWGACAIWETCPLTSAEYGIKKMLKSVITTTKLLQ